MFRSLRISGRLWAALTFLALLPAAPAKAHFLWIAVDGGTHQTHLSFGESPDEPTPAELVARLAEAKPRDAASKALALQQGEGGWNGATPGLKTVAATQEWGVVDRSGDGSGAFLLFYYAKGAAGIADSAADTKLALELFARQEGSQIVAALKRGGKPVANSPFHLSLPSGRSLDRNSDEKGEVRFDADGGGLYGVRARSIEERKGEKDGKAFGEVRHYATLTFTLPGAAKGATPAMAEATTDGAVKGATATKADPEAYALLKKAHDSRQVMPPDFAGFRCELSFQRGDDTLRGQLVYLRKGETKITLEGADEATLTWAKNQIQNLVGHRRGGDFAQGDGRHPLELAPDDHNPYGRLIVLHDEMQSSYRVKDNRVTEVTRTADGSRFTISVIESMNADDGKYLANHFLVTYRDAATGAIQKLEGYRDGYARVQGIWLPTFRTIIEVGDATSPTVRTLRFRKIEELDASGNLLPAGAPTAPSEKKP